jgi:hypothetical protein
MNFRAAWTAVYTAREALLRAIEAANKSLTDAATLALSNIEQVRPGMPVLEVATKTGTGIEPWINALLTRRLALLNSR